MVSTFARTAKKKRIIIIINNNNKPSLPSHMNSPLDTVCLRLRDTKMADSNRC